MDLESFITQSLVSLVKGVETAQDELGGGVVVPSRLGDFKDQEKTSGNPISIVKFDVAVSASEEKGAKGSISVLNIGAGANKALHSKSSSRIQFEVSIALPKSSGE